MSKIVVLGGGYGGLTVVQELLEHLPSDARIYLVDRMPYQGLKTEYYALAAGTVSDLEIRVNFPVHPQLQMVYGDVTDVDLDNKIVHITEQEPLSYDSLVIALGCTDNYHGIVGAPEFSCSIQSLSSTRRTFQQINDIRPYGQLTIVGGGLSGVEVAAELRESRADINIRILDRGNSVMSAFPGKLQTYVADWFRQHDVEMRSHISITSLEQGVLHNGDEPILTDVTVWTAGIQPVELVQRMSLPKDPQGRLIVNEWHELPDAPHVYVIGDCSSQPFSPSAQLAGAQGKQVAEIIRARLDNKEPKLSSIKLKGVLGSLGKKAGFGLMGATPLLGRIPRMLKSGVLWKSKRHFG
ncbi:NAD(P)/FAD-dependent oxidoreductase [Cohnella cholangitidis]|uniref:NAD(P)/FAD-dependent oxidoreductase n=1 Tax=Cohnella cholangitidis TaxID=2598458 RepID=A0A7G5BVB0_9BACL|nr:NAD(P)/FAD-dependent oxidoreductase [Cohnella cholangitidis]QMV40894.1 NAD(P)/FAD-dependent oxidoreductase [Cohnella cholangitidis]